jgi:hypothetical protein
MIRHRLGEPIHFDRISLVPVECISVEPTVAPHGRWISATKEPVAVLVRDDSGIRAIGMDGRALPVSELPGRVEGLAEWLAGHSTPAGGHRSERSLNPGGGFVPIAGGGQ